MSELNDWRTSRETYEQTERIKSNLENLTWDEALKIHQEYGDLLAKQDQVKSEVADFRREKLGITEEKESELEKPFAWKVAEIPELPGKKILISEIVVGGKTREALEEELENVCSGGITDRGQEAIEKILTSKEFEDYSRLTEKVRLVRVIVKDLGFSSKPNVPELLGRIERIGELCRRTDALDLRIDDKDQPLDEWYDIAMEPFPKSNEFSNFFSLGRDDNGVKLDSYSRSVYSVTKVDLDDSIVFRYYGEEDTNS